MVRESWSSNWGFILASIGSAVGIGNIWRFPYIVGSNGGGSFLVPYAIAVFLVGLPLMALEFGIGQQMRASVVPAFAAIRRSYRWAGVSIVVIVSIIVGYYMVITGWILAYALFFMTGRTVVFGAFIGSLSPLIFYLLVVGIVFAVVRTGVRAGIETLSTMLIPVLFVLLAGLAAYALTLPGAADGIAFYLTPDTSSLADPFVWTAAFGQAFFSLSVGMGVMITYGSYSRNLPIMKNSAIIAVCDTCASLVAGLFIFPIVFTFGLVPTAGIQLAFVTLPPVFETMRYGSIVGAAFFALLFIAALTSAVSMIEVPVSTAIDVAGMDRKQAAVVVSVLVGLGGLPSALSYSATGLHIVGLPFLDILDLTFGTFGLVVAGLLISILIGWSDGTDGVLAAIGCSRTRQRCICFLVRFVIPAVLGLTLVMRILQYIG